MSQVALGLVAGSLADRALGDPRRLHPVAGFGLVAGELERAVWRPHRTSGALYVLVLVGGAAGVAWAIDAHLRRSPVARVFFAASVAWAALGGRSLSSAALSVTRAVDRGDLDEARRLLPALAGRDASELDAPEICRAVVESVAENTADAVVGPLVWGAVAGPAGIVAYRASNTLDAMVGHRDERYERFGWAAARLDDVLTWPAARLAALLAVALAPLAGGNAARAWGVFRRDGDAHPSPNSGRLEAAFAGAFGVRLGGRNRYGTHAEERPAIGHGPPPGPETVMRAARLSDLVGIAATAICAFLAWRARR